MYERSVVGVQDVPADAVSRYGIVGATPIPQSLRLSQIHCMAEKPQPAQAPSTLAIIGRYILTPKIFEFLDDGNIGAGGEIQLTDALVQVNEIQGMVACEFEGRRYDVGEKLGFIEATIELALARSVLRQELQAIMRRLVTSEELVVS